MSKLPISTVVEISVAAPQTGLSNYRVNNLAIFTKDAPINVAITKTNPGVYRSIAAVAADWGVLQSPYVEVETYAMALAIFAQSPNILSGGGSLIIYPMDSGDVLVDAMTALAKLCFFGGALWCAYAPTDNEVKAAGVWAEASRKLLFVPRHLTAALDPGGLFAYLATVDEPHVRALLYTQEDAAASRIMAAAYASVLMSVDFEGSLTARTMNLKDLTGIVPDENVDTTLLTKCATLGVDVYADVAGLAKVISQGANDFADNVYNLDWFVFALEVAVFNALARTPTKIPQTEIGMAYLKGAAIGVCDQAVRVGYVAPGQWNSSELFGNPDDLKANVLKQGWYVWSLPVNQQNQADREARIAPLIQIAIKLAGAVHTASVVVNVNP